MSGETIHKLTRVFSGSERASAQRPQPHSRLEALYKMAGGRQSDFERILDRGRGIAQRLGAQIQSTGSVSSFERAKSEVAMHPDQPHVIVAALKGKQRAGQKVRGKYGGDVTKLTDLVRGTVLVPHVDDLPKAIDVIRRELPAGWSIAKPENRFVKGRRGDRVNPGPMSSGYRDIALLLRAPDGFHAELQVNTTHMWLAKEAQGGHAMYEERRQITEANPTLSTAQANRVRQLDSRGRELYGSAMIRSTRQPRRRG